jgi:hypothetical protein
MMTLQSVMGAIPAAVVFAFLATQSGPPARAVLCAPVDRPAAEAARALEPLGDAARTALMTLAGGSSKDDIACGVAGLAALRDRRVVAPARAALTNPAFHDDAYRFARWAAYVAGGPEADLGPAFLPLVSALEDAAVWKAAGDDGIRLLGEIDDAAARTRLAAEFARPQTDATLDALVYALARQGDGQLTERIAALGREALVSHAGNATYEQARRIGAVSFYLLATAAGTQAAGVDLLRKLAPADQADTAAWAVQTWCQRAVRRPGEKVAADQRAAALAAEFDGMGIRWRDLARGAFACAPAP